MRYCRLTDKNSRTRDTQWGENITHKATGKGNTLCSPDVIHVYDHPYKAVLFNPIHANFENPILWKCRVRHIVANDGLKVGVKECTTIKQIPMPKFTLNQKVAFGIYCAKEVYHDEQWNKWADNWLNSTDRSCAACAAAKHATYAADATYAAADATYAAADAAAYVAKTGIKLDLVKLARRALKIK